MAKRLAVADEKFEIARIRLINRRIVNFVDDAVAEGKPDPAAGRIRGSKTFLRAGGPTRRDSGRTKRVTSDYCFNGTVGLDSEPCVNARHRLIA